MAGVEESFENNVALAPSEVINVTYRKTQATILKRADSSALGR
jgi:hypothetical protein